MKRKRVGNPFNAIVEILDVRLGTLRDEYNRQSENVREDLRIKFESGGFKKIEGNPHRHTMLRDLGKAFQQYPEEKFRSADIQI